MKEHYDVVIIGSGLGGLVSATIMAKEGKRVCVLEKNNQYGGNLQTFARDKTIFDTGVHYIGGLSEGQNLYRYFNYLEIMQNLKLKKLDEDGFDIISFDGDPNEYPHAQGYENFIKQLSALFPEEEDAIKKYVEKTRQTTKNFPLYELNKGKPYYENTDFFGESAKQFIDTLTDNEKLKAVLGGTNLLYGGEEYRSPLYVHALSVNSYLQSAYRCVNGGSQITKLFIKVLKKYGADVYNHQEVVDFKVVDKKVVSVKTIKGDEIKGDIFISNVDPKLTLPLVGEENFRKSYVKRVKDIESTIAAFSLYIVLKPGTFKYLNRNYYHFKSEEYVWNALNYTQESWPEGYMVSMGVKKNMDEYGDNLTAMTYMRFEEVEPWANTHNTVAKKDDRGRTYAEFKEQKTEIFIVELEKKFPNIRSCIKAIYSSTPLSYRDYIGCNEGSMYGFVKDVENPLKSFVSPRTRIQNLYFTGQCLNMHGILGVTISGVVTCSEILGKDYLLDKILEANKTVVNAD